MVAVGIEPRQRTQTAFRQKHALIAEGFDEGDRCLDRLLGMDFLDFDQQRRSAFGDGRARAFQHFALKSLDVDLDEPDGVERE